MYGLPANVQVVLDEMTPLTLVCPKPNVAIKSVLMIKVVKFFTSKLRPDINHPICSIEHDLIVVNASYVRVVAEVEIKCVH